MVVRSDEKLKLLLLGKDGRRAKQGVKGKPVTLPSAATRQRPMPMGKQEEVNSKDENGRTSVGKSKIRLPKAEALGHDVIDDSAKDGAESAPKAERPKPRRKAKAASYIDEVLAEKARKDEKRLHRRKQLKADDS